VGARRPTARVKANRLNAKISSGPRTREGKSRSSRNAFVDGMSTLNSDTPAVRALSEALLADMISPENDPRQIDALTNFARAQAQVVILQSALNCAHERLRNQEKTCRTSTDLDAGLSAIYQQGALLISLGVKLTITREQLEDLEAYVKFVHRLARRSKTTRANSVSRLQVYQRRALAARRRAAKAPDDAS